MLVHGFSGSSEYLTDLAKCLVDEGYRVLRPDLYGRGHSGMTDTYFTVEMFTTLLAELLFKLHYNGKIHLVGYSMGGAISMQVKLVSCFCYYGVFFHIYWS